MATATHEVDAGALFKAPGHFEFIVFNIVPSLL